MKASVSKNKTASWLKICNNFKLNSRLLRSRGLQFKRSMTDFKTKWLNWIHNSRPLRKRMLPFQKLLQVSMIVLLSYLHNSRPLRMKRPSSKSKSQDSIMMLRSSVPDSRKPRSQRNTNTRNWACKSRLEHSLNNSKKLVNHLLKRARVTLSPLIPTRGISTIKRASSNRHCSVMILPLRARLDSHSVITLKCETESPLKSEILSMH